MAAYALQFIPYLRITSTSVRSFRRRVTSVLIYIQKALSPASILSAPRPGLESWHVSCISREMPRSALLRASSAPATVFPNYTLCSRTNYMPHRIAGCTGSLTDVALRYARTEKRLHARQHVWYLYGTLELTDEHLHLAVSDPTGYARRPYDAGVYRAYHARAPLSAKLPALTFSRQQYAISGYDELCIFLPLIDDSLEVLARRPFFQRSSLWC